MKSGLLHLNKRLASGKKACCEAGLNTTICEHEAHQADLHQQKMFEGQDCGEERFKERLGVSQARKLNLETDDRFLIS